MRVAISLIKTPLAGKASKDFKPLNMRNHSLLLNLATDNDEGFYMCQATNEIGAGLKKIIRINVNGNAKKSFIARAKLTNGYNLFSTLYVMQSRRVSSSPPVMSAHVGTIRLHWIAMRRAMSP